MMDSDPSRRVGKYDLLGRIGYGGMAEVWLARQKGPMGFEKLVAVKRLLPHLQGEDQFVRMFLDEARIAARINHANVVQIFDLGQVDDNYFIAMEYLVGECLARVMGEGAKRQQPLPELLSAMVVSQMCKGLHHAHSLRDARGTPLCIVHRDVSPQNVVLLYDGSVKLLDFGIAKARQRLAETTTTGMKGKYAYMSPEQCSGSSVDHRSDLFACGVVLWECLTRRRLFKHQSKLMVLKMILEGHVAPPSRVNPQVPAALDEICLRALAKSADERYSTGEEMSAAIDGVLSEAHEFTGPSQLADYMVTVFGEDQRKRAEWANTAALAEPVGRQETAEHWLEFLPSATNEIISFSRSPAVIPTGGKPLPQPSPVWWIATAVVATLAAVVAIVLLLFSSGGKEAKLYVDSTPPGAMILVDGQPVPQRSPAQLGGLKAGSHRLHLSLSRHAPWTRQLTLHEGETLRVEAALRPEVESASPDAVVAHARPDAVVAHARPDARLKLPDVRGTPPDSTSSAAPPPDHRLLTVKTPAKLDLVRRELGTLNLATDPWATIYHGKRRLGDTPLVGVRLPVGRLHLTAVNPEEKIQTTFVVEIKRNKLTRHRLVLRRR
jgi:eukaryotic-like serine/threonine-protein kinase